MEINADESKIAASRRLISLFTVNTFSIPKSLFSVSLLIVIDVAYLIDNYTVVSISHSKAIKLARAKTNMSSIVRALSVNRRKNDKGTRKIPYTVYTLFLGAYQFAYNLMLIEYVRNPVLNARFFLLPNWTISIQMSKLYAGWFNFRTFFVKLPCFFWKVCLDSRNTISIYIVKLVC